ncbi:hypothetical protein [Massilia sp. KIM]|uniref:hypothetical protein n=1 Tax=Massilia sp. KIM TaxID=1955422 RepID=UPI0011804D64|nr:hypothetical protein [Massilia sp. KIM]
MKFIKLLLLMLTGGCLSLDSQAQSFGDFLKNSAVEAARSAVAGNVNRAVTATVDKAFKGGAEATASDAAQPAGADTAAAPAAVSAPAAAAKLAVPPGCLRMRGASLVLGPKPDSFEHAILWPENAHCPVGGFTHFEFKAAQEAKHAFRKASEVRCNDCEGGYYPDAWGGRSLIKKGDYATEFPKLLVSLKQGESVGWKGNKYHVSITALGAQPIGETPCKQFRYQLKDGGKQVAEYIGMFCEYTRPYSSKATWNEVV